MTYLAEELFSAELQPESGAGSHEQVDKYAELSETLKDLSENEAEQLLLAELRKSKES